MVHGFWKRRARESAGLSRLLGARGGEFYWRHVVVGWRGNDYRYGFVVICTFECGNRGMKDWLSIFAWLAAGFSLLFLSIIVVLAAN
jgi:hypothetical protein